MTFVSDCNKSWLGMSKIFAPMGAPEKLLDREGLWNAAEAAERKANSVYAQEFNAGLPHELNTQQQKDLIADFIQNHYVKMGIICDVNVHLKPTNNHLHCMMTTRYIDHSTDTGFAKGKSRDWWRIGSVQRDRIAYCKYINKHLSMAGSSVRYSHKTLKEQGIDRIPQIHVGQKAKALEARGIHSDRVEINNNIIAFNTAAAKVKAAKAALEKVEKERLEKKKAEQELSAKKHRMADSQAQYLRLHTRGRKVWAVRKAWIAAKPVKPALDTLDGSRHRRAMTKWSFEGSKIRKAMKSVIRSMRGIINSYLHEFHSDIRDDIKNNHHDIEHEINGP